MSSKNFVVQHHVLPTSHIRGYAHAMRTFEEDVLQIAIKQYTPLNNSIPQPGDVTIIAAHANGVPKEMYEPLWDELLGLSQKSKAFRIRSIWIADVAHQGESSVLNESKLGNDPSWFDHPRDLFLMVNHFRDQMPRPLVGIGHSLGGNNIVNLSLLHPRLFSTVLLIDPVIQRSPDRKGNYNPAIASTYRRDVWPSRKIAEDSFRRNKFYQSWDPRVLELWLQYGLRDLPTAIYPKPPQFKQSELDNVEELKPVTLTTPKYQEVFTFLRANHPAAKQSLESWNPPRSTHPDIPETGPTKPFYNGAATMTFSQLPHLRPPCFYIFAEDSDLSKPEHSEAKMEATGVGEGGSGGTKAGLVSSVLMPKAGHFVPFEQPLSTAQHMYGWLDKILAQWNAQEEETRKAWAAVPERERFTFSEDRLWWTQWQRKAPAGKL